MIASGLGLISTIMGMIGSSVANRRAKNELDALAAGQKISPAIGQGEQIYREMASQGLPGYENRLSDIDQSVPMTANQLRDFLSGGGAVDMINRIWSNRNKAVTDLQTADDAAKIENRQRLAQYLAGVVAPAQERLQDNLSSLSMAKIGINQAQTQDIMNYINTLLNTVGNDRLLYSWLNNKLGGKNSDNKDNTIAMQMNAGGGIPTSRPGGSGIFNPLYDNVNTLYAVR